MSDVLSRLPGQILYIATSVVLVAVSILLQDFIKWMLPRLFPLRLPEGEAARAGELRRRFAEDLNDLEVVEYLLSVGAMVSVPFLNYQLLRKLLMLNALPSDRFLFTGGSVVFAGSVVGGALLGPYLTRQYLRARHGSSPELAWLYLRSEDRHGALGRFLITWSGVLAACLIVIPMALSAGKYTLVGERRIEIPDPEQRFSRVALPNAEIVEIVKERTGKSNEYTVIYRDGRKLTSRESLRHVGELAGFGQGPRKAVEFLSSVTRLPVKERPAA